MRFRVIIFKGGKIIYDMTHPIPSRKIAENYADNMTTQLGGDRYKVSAA